MYEDHVFEPIGDVECFKACGMMVAIFPQRPVKKGMRAVAGTMTHDKAGKCRNLLMRSYG